MEEYNLDEINYYSPEEVEEKLQKLATYSAKLRLVEYAKMLTNEAWNETLRSIKKQGKKSNTLKKLKEMQNDYLQKFSELDWIKINNDLARKASEEQHGETMQKINNFFDEIKENKKLKLIKKENTPLEKGKILWSLNKPESRIEAAREFEKASEQQNEKLTQKELLIITAEAYGKNRMFEDEIRIHRKIRELEEKQKSMKI